MICRECGANIDDNALECKFCGAVYGENEPEKAVNEETTDVNTEETIQEVPQDDIQEIFDENEIKRRLQMEKIREEKQSKLEEIEKRRSDKKRRQRRNRVFVVLLVLLCAGAIAAGVYYIGPTSGDDGDGVVIVTQQPTSSPESTEPTEEPTPLPTVEPVETAEPTQTASTPVTTNKPATSSTSSNASAKKSNTASSNTSKKPSAATAKPAATKTPITQSVPTSTGSYVFPTSATNLLTSADLEGKTAEQLRLGRNEIYARHGRKFKDSALQNYFNSCSWYSVNDGYDYSNDAANLSDIEKKNINLIKKYEAEIK